MFRLGWIFNGPELGGSWTDDVCTRIATLLSGDASPGLIDLMVHVGGSLGEPGWAGPGRPSRRKDTVGFDIGVPRDQQDEDLETRLLDYVEQALATGVELCRKAGVRFDQDGHAAILAAARGALARLQPASERRQAFRAVEARYARRPRIRDATPEPYQPTRQPAQIRIAFRWSTTAELDELFGAQEAVDKALTARSIGEVDGNEVGSGEFYLFLAPDAGQARRCRELAMTIVADRTVDRLLVRKPRK